QDHRRRRRSRPPAGGRLRGRVVRPLPAGGGPGRRAVAPRLEPLRTRPPGTVPGGARPEPDRRSPVLPGPRRPRPHAGRPGVRLAQLGAGRILFPIGLGALVVAGWLYQTVVAARARGPARDRAAATLVWVLVPAVYLPLAYGLLRLFGPGDITLQLPNRGLGY